MSNTRTYIAPIVEWNQEKGFGFLEYEGKRLLLHAYEFKTLTRRVQVGDDILFNLGTDNDSRQCAKNARHAENGLKCLHLLLLAALLVAPGLAIQRFALTHNLRLILGIAAFVLGLTYLMYWEDKRRARVAGWRVPENTMHFMELIGGWPAAYLAQCVLRHKRSKFSYRLTFWLIVALYQFVAVDYLRGWPLLQDARHGLEHVMKSK
jgi:uncharacterized membrane protein YsdA (DUF1294 family)/cold shock CspA family protein